MIKELIYFIFGFDDKPTEVPDVHMTVKESLYFVIPSLIMTIVSYSLDWYFTLIFSVLFLIGGIYMLFDSKN